MNFHDRQDAGRQLAGLLRGRDVHDPLVLAIPRGGVVVGASLAREIGADLDIILARKLRAPSQPEAAIGAVSESGQIYLTDDLSLSEFNEYLTNERQHQMAEMAQRNRLLRGARSQAPIGGRSIIVTDDGIATGSTMIAALKEIRAKQPRDIVVAVPVAAPDSLELVRVWSDDVLCLHCPADFWAVSHYYRDFQPVEDRQVIDLIQGFQPPRDPSRRFLPNSSSP